MICVHCGQPIRAGVLNGFWLHVDLHGHTGKHRCDPALTGRPYGLEATPQRKDTP